MFPQQGGGASAGRFLKLGAGEGNRTPDPRITNALLYQLSYPGIEFASLTATAPDLKASVRFFALHIMVERALALRPVIPTPRSESSYRGRRDYPIPQCAVQRLR